MVFFHSIPQFFQYRVILFALSSPMHMTAIIYNKPLFRHKTEGKNSKGKHTKQNVFQLFQQARQSNWNCHTAAELIDKEHIHI